MIKTIDFKEFVRNEHSFYLLKKDFKTYSFVPVVGLISSSLVAKGYMIVGGVGAVMILAAFLENVLADNEKSDLARLLVEFIKLAMPIGLIAALIIFIMYNPLL